MDNIACTVEHPTLETSNIMMKHKAIQLIAATGGPGVVTAVLSSGRRGIGAGAGNPPALVDETADLRKAAEDIVNGCTFDNNLPCIAERDRGSGLRRRRADELHDHRAGLLPCVKGRAGCSHGSRPQRRKAEQKMCGTRREDPSGDDRRDRAGQYQMYHI